MKASSQDLRERVLQADPGSIPGCRMPGALLWAVHVASLACCVRLSILRAALVYSSSGEAKRSSASTEGTK
jgi:hypothetical protein